MKFSHSLLLAGTVALALGACSKAPSGEGNAAAPTNMAAPVAADASMTAADASNPFAGAEQKMAQAMMSTVGTDVGDNWAKKMIAHHQGAIDMAEIVLRQNPPADVAKVARDTIEKQRKGIATIRKLEKSGTPDQRSAELYRPAMMDMQQKMQAATAPTVAETFMRKMAEHHKGAVAMSDVALQHGVTGALRDEIQKTREENATDAKMVEAMINGRSMKASGAKSAAEVRSEVAPADRGGQQR